LTLGNVAIHKLENVVTVAGEVDLSLSLDESLSDGHLSVLHKVLQVLRGDVLTVELANEDTSSGVLLLPKLSLVIGRVVSIIIGETLVEDHGESLVLVGTVDVESRSLGRILGNSLDHHGHGDVVVVGGVLDLISVLLEDGVEGVVTDDLSEGLESDRLDAVTSEGGRNLQGDGLDLIDGDDDGLGVHIKGITSRDLDEGAGGSGRIGVLSSLLSVLGLLVALLAFLAVLLGTRVLCFKVSFLSLLLFGGDLGANF